MKKISRQMIEKIINDKNLKRNDITVILSLLYFANEKNGAIIIQHITKYTLFLKLIRSFTYLNMASLYRSFKRLEEAGYISFRNNTVFINDDELIDAFTKEFKTKGYVILPDFVFSHMFCNKSLSAKRLILKLLSMLNSDINHKPVRLDPHSLLELLRKNTVQKVRNVFDEISDLFIIEHNSNDIFECSISKESFNYKLVIRNVSYQSIFRRVYKTVKSFLNLSRYNYTLEEIEGLVWALRLDKKKNIRYKLLKYINIDYEIFDLTAYLQSFDL